MTAKNNGVQLGISEDDGVRLGIDELELEEQLRQTRPVPPAGWRGSLRRELVLWPVPPSRPARLWLRVGASASLGAGLLALALLGS